MTAVLYGIPNCDTVKKARAWLAAHAIAYVFHDHKKADVDEAALRGWVDRLGWEVVLNRSGTTFRKLPVSDRTGLDAARAIAIMLANPSAIRRPIVVTDDSIAAGFDPARYAALFG